MDLNQTITITYGDGTKKADIPLKNFLRLSLVYLLPLVHEYFAGVNKTNNREYAVGVGVWSGLLSYLKEKLDIPRNGKVLL